MPEAPRTAEGALVRDELDRTGGKVRPLARSVGISDTQLRNWIRGYDARGAEVTYPAKALALTAHVLQLSAEKVRATGRSDAAALLDRILSGDLIVEVGTTWRRTGTVGRDSDDDDGLASIPRSSLEGMGPAEREEVIAAARLSALEKAREIRRRQNE